MEGAGSFGTDLCFPSTLCILLNVELDGGEQKKTCVAVCEILEIITSESAMACSRFYSQYIA